MIGSQRCSRLSRREHKDRGGMAHPRLHPKNCQVVARWPTPPILNRRFLMVAQLQPREERVDIPHASPSDTHANPRAKAAKKKRGATKRHPGLAGWMTRAVAILGPIAAIVGIVATLWHLNPPQQPAPDPRIEIDEQATLTRNASNNQLELHVNLTLLNEGGRVALIPRPRVSLYVESPDEVQNVPADDLHFKFADGTNEVIFPVSLHEGAGSFQRQIVCSIAEGREGAWYR